ncbi:MAG: CGNR zinc finger domain-containing protein [Candidatus Limnocylindrales bacterium]
MQVTSDFGMKQLMAVANTRHGPAGHWHARVSVDGPDHDHLSDAEAAMAFLGSHSVTIPEDAPSLRQLRALREIREAVRAGSGALDEVRAGATYRLEVGPRLVPAGVGWDAIIAGLLIPLAELEAQRASLRVCANPLCRFMFIDRSRNRSRVWCDMSGCGNRAKTSRYRQRHHATLA